MKILILVLAVFVCSCRSVKYVPVESVKTKTEYIDRLQRDSIHVKDSVFMLVRGDTVFRDRYRTEFRNLYVRDTINVQVKDTIRVAYPVDVIKNKVPGVVWWIVLVLAAFSLPSIVRIVAKIKGNKYF